MSNLNNYGFLAIGQCGGNQVAAFKKYNVKSFYINSAKEDLQSLGDDIHSYHIPNAEGCHRDRNVSKQYLAQNYQDILSNITRYLDTKYIFLFASLSGGTSSGQVALMTDLLENELNKIVIPVCTVPKLDESYQAKKNAYSCLEEIIESSQHTLFLVDNNKEPNFSKSNLILANNIYSLISDIGTSTEGIYDASEINSMLEQKGYGFVNTYNRKISRTDITQDIVNAIKGGIHADIEKHNSLYYLGLKTSTLKKTININFEHLKLEYGFFQDCFIGYQTKSDLLFMSGLKYPLTVINGLYEALQSDKRKAEQDLKVNSSPIFKNDFDIDVNKSVISETKRNTLSAKEKLMQMMNH